MAKFFIQRPIFAIVISLILVIVGTLAAFSLPVAQYPQISPPTVSVSTTYTGANANVINETVAQVIEQQVNGTQGVDYMSSSSDDSGKYSLSVVFTLGTDGDMDSVKVQNNVAIANASLPADVQTRGVTTKKASSDMALIGSIYSPNGTYSREFLKNYVDIYIMDKIKRVPGVGDVNIFGPDYSMRVWLNPDRLAELGLTVADVTSAVKEQNIQAPAGTVGMMPAPDTQEKQYTGKVAGRLVTAEDFGNVIVRSGANGSFVRLKDIARIEEGARTNSVESNTDGKVGIGFGIMLTNDANAMDTVSGVKQVIEEAKRDFPPDMEYVEINDTTDFIKASIFEVAETFFEALLLVMIIVFVFLQSWRATVIPMLAVPVSLIATFGSFVILGFSINTLTLFAMVLAIGLVVDDAIVVIENVERNMTERNLDPKTATEIAMDEVQGPVVAIAIVLAAVFVPVAFLGGMMGVLYRQFALTIAVSVMLSAFVALTLTPALCATMLKPHQENEEKGRIDKFFDSFNVWFEKITKRYLGGVSWLTGNIKLAVLSLVILTVLAGALFKVVPSTFVPDEDQGFVIASLQLPEGASLNQTGRSMMKLNSVIAENPGVRNVMAITGYDVLTSAAKSNAGTLFIGYDDWSKRKTAETQIKAAIGRIFGEGAQVTPEASVIAFIPPALPGLGMVGGFNLQLQDMSGHTDEELDVIVKEIVAAANQRPELQGVYSTFKINSLVYQFDVDREKVKNLGVQLSDVFTALQVNFGGYEVNDFNRFGRTYKVVMQSDTTYRNEAEAAKFVFVKSNTGTLVPLDTLLKPRVTTGTSVISRFNAARAVAIQGSPAPGYSSGQAMNAIEEVVREKAPAGFNIDWSGQSREEKSSGSKTVQVLAMALIFVFLCLAALYESWSVPFAVLLTVPTGIFGALLSEYVMNQQNSIYMQIGIITIIGLAAKNAILIVEFAKARTDKGMDPIKAAVEAAGLRLRPIIMTSLAFIIGCLPLAVASGAGAAARNNMGIAVVGGMIFATALGVFLIPIFFVIVEIISAKLSGAHGAKKKTAEDYM
ncbi:efflux RND transporter permease subunit [Schwartzia succinivorans]|uniref:Hydrophobic/amphiphilic exporter-1, HAE1 family n=1 Tax=Schwartzia succinivorans DSM 10502 TaxID=1123243 RepID=A0A1M4T4V8_9FIRM|nr:multidrug efflux RND transporter permease subunit [Schwartzia succinivorans]SHE39444.1 hydrophobic/amphiphilic exporter-1, HAE1 family [Schwartzia succinivorans DSM 10502]